MGKKASKETQSKQEKVDLCLKWAIDHGSSIPALYQFEYNTQKHGVYCKLSENDLVHREQLKFSPLKIDESIVLSNDLAFKFLANFVEKKTIAKARKQHLNILLKLFLVSMSQYEDHPLIKEFKPYFDILPKKFSSSIFWTKEELSIVGNTDLSRKTLQVLNNSIEPELKTIKWMKLPFEVTENSYKWAHCIISSRGFPSILLGEMSNKMNKLEAILWPIVDFLNHSNNVRIQWSLETDENNSTKQLQFLTLDSNLNKREEESFSNEFEIFNDYGENKNSEDYIVNYGFALECITDDFVTITTRVANEDYVKLCQEKFLINFVESFKDVNGDETYIVKFSLHYNKFPIYLIKFFSVACRLTSEEFISKRSTLEGLSHINSTLTQMLETYKGKLVTESGKPIQEDVISLIKKYQGNFKKILTSNLDMLQSYSNVLIKESNDLFSYKAQVSNNGSFQKVLKHYLQKASYKDLLLDENIMNVSLLMYIIHQSKKEISIETLDDDDYETTSFVRETFFSVYKSYIITNEDYLDYAPQFTSFIENPMSSFSFTLEDFIIADIVVDRITWEKPSSKEIFFIKQEEYSLS
ncbi:hypothetical protein QEN19_001452 [Hanseniaspora menglaensis]